MPLETCASCNLEASAKVMEHCHECKAPICKDCMQENLPYTYPDNLPYCPAHQPDNE